MTDWRTYQEEVAELFRELGCQATTDAVVQGARSEHRIDVWVVFTQFGLEHRWVIECKKWQSSIPKEKVLTLKGVVEDVGADRGIIVADSGFQPAAITAANKTNITLTGLADLRTQAKADFHAVALKNLERKMLQFVDRGLDLFHKHVDDQVHIVGELGALEAGFQYVKLGKFPAPVGSFSTDWITGDENIDGYVYAASVGEFIEKAALFLGFIEDRLILLEKSETPQDTP